MVAPSSLRSATRARNGVRHPAMPPQPPTEAQLRATISRLELYVIPYLFTFNFPDPVFSGRRPNWVARLLPRPMNWSRYAVFWPSPRTLLQLALLSWKGELNFFNVPEYFLICFVGRLLSWRPHTGSTMLNLSIFRASTIPMLLRLNTSLAN